MPEKAQTLSPELYRYDQFLGAVGHLREREDRAILVRSVTKSLSRTYDKGQVLSDGRVRPWRLP